MTEELRYLTFAEGGTANLTIKIAMLGMPGKSWISWTLDYDIAYRASTS